MRAKSEPGGSGSARSIIVRSERLVDERRRPVVRGEMGGEHAHNDRDVVEREPNHPPPVAHGHAAPLRSSRRSKSAMSPRGVDQRSRSSSAGEMLTPKASSNA